MYTNTKIWINTIEPQGDSFDTHRERLRQVFSSFRIKVGQLIQTIPAEIHGLTVHDLSHLDALWEMADILTATGYELNPAEIFVLGGAILLHDSAMTVCAYSGGVQEIKSTPQYADAFAQFQTTLPKSPFQSSGQSTTSAEQFAISETLRIKHASKAEELATQKWTSPIDNSEIFLIDDAELRDHFGRCIGRIAHSHHWDITEIPKKLGTTLGALSGFPSDWTIDQIKIALLLRCVDAMQIDDRRAPRFLSAVRSIGETSMEHWRFQNLLTVPHVEDGRLVYTSKRPFRVDEATAWNLCFDTLVMIDQELRNTNDLHLQKNLPQFSVKGVVGAGSSDALARYIEVEGWKPLPLNLKVSNVPHLARTLGGRDLYNSPYAPLRELIQNAADAIEARALVEEDFSIEDGLITIRFIESESETILQVEDNGVGMSERVLTTVLLDFGFSFWKSSAARSEFPGIQKDVEKFRGRYGIGFFSVFMWSSEVLVSSRRFNEGVDDSRILDFQKGLESRPLLRPAAVGEKSSKWTSRVQLKLKRDFLEFSPKEYNYVGRYELAEIQRSWSERIKLLCGALPIKVNFEQSGRTEKASLPNWRDCPADDFLNFFSGVIFNDTWKNDHFVGTLTALSDPAPLGGRCYITPYERERINTAVYDKGIFVNFAHSPNICGIVESSTTNAARDKFSTLTLHKDQSWANEALLKAFAICRHLGEKIAVQKICSSLGAPDPKQPLFIRNRELVSLVELQRKILNEGIFSIKLTETENNIFSWKPEDKLSIIVGLTVDEKRVYPLIPFEGNVQNGSDINGLITTGTQPLFCFLNRIRELLGPGAKVESAYFEKTGYKNNYIVINITANSGA